MTWGLSPTAGSHSLPSRIRPVLGAHAFATIIQHAQLKGRCLRVPVVPKSLDQAIFEGLCTMKA